MAFHTQTDACYTIAYHLVDVRPFGNAEEEEGKRLKSKFLNRICHIEQELPQESDRNA